MVTLVFVKYDYGIIANYKNIRPHTFPGENLITITLPAPSDFNFKSTVESHGWYQLAPNRYDAEKAILQRPYKLDNGKSVTLTMQGGKSATLIIHVDGQAIISSRDRNNIMQSATHMFNLKQNLTPFYMQMSKTEGYEWLAEKKPARLLASPTVWEDLAKTLLTTNTSWGNTLKMAERLTAIDPDNIFPSPQTITTLLPDEFAEQVGMGYRAPYLYEVAQRIASGELDVENWRSLDSATLYKRILNLTGFGDYATGTVMRLIGHYDKLAIDTIARKAYEAVTGNVPENDSDIRKYYEKFGKWRGLVLWMDCIRDEIEDAAQAIAE